MSEGCAKNGFLTLYLHVRSVNYLDEVTGDLGQADAAIPAHLKISANTVS